jgi:hypothetical protein
LEQVTKLQKQSNKAKIELEERREESDRFKVGIINNIDNFQEYILQVNVILNILKDGFLHVKSRTQI